ncbi:MAG: hypothetical protein ACSHX5_09755 [Phycisphaerales bacterium]
MNTQKKLINSASFIAVAAIATASNADLVDMQFTGTGAGSNVQIQLGFADAKNVFAGELNHVISSATGLSSYLNGEHRTFCADITESVSSSGAQYLVAPLETIPLTATVTTPMSTQRADAIRALYRSSSATLLAGDLSNAYAAAMQLTVWEIVNDFDGSADSINLDQGTLRVTGTNGSDMNQDILDQLSNLKSDIMFALNQQDDGIERVIGLSNSGAQDQLVTIPAPGAFALIAIGGLITHRRRRL